MVFPERKRRDRLEIMAKVIDKTVGGALKTNIMYGCNLSFVQLNEYLGVIISLNLSETKEKDGKTLYYTTNKGKLFLSAYMLMRDLISSTGDKDPYSDKVVKMYQDALAPVTTSIKKRNEEERVIGIKRSL